MNGDKKKNIQRAIENEAMGWRYNEQPGDNLINFFFGSEMGRKEDAFKSNWMRGDAPDWVTNMFDDGSKDNLYDRAVKAVIPDDTSWGLQQKALSLSEPLESRQDLSNFYNRVKEETGSGARAGIRTGLNMAQVLPANWVGPTKAGRMLWRYGVKPAWKALPTWGKVTTGAGGTGGAGYTIWDQFFNEEGE